MLVDASMIYNCVGSHGQRSSQTSPRPTTKVHLLCEWTGSVSGDIVIGVGFGVLLLEGIVIIGVVISIGASWQSLCSLLVVKRLRKLLRSFGIGWNSVSNLE